MKIRLVTSVLIITMLLGTVAFADLMPQEEVVSNYLSDLVELDRIHKYDYTSSDADDEAEALNYSDAVTVVTALNLMSYDDNGQFNEDSLVKMSEFAKLIARLTMGNIDVFDEEYDRYEDTDFLTQNEAAHYLVLALGHDALIYEPEGEWPYVSLAQKAGILRRISFNGNRNITRGELSQMIYNALTVDMVEQTTYSDSKSTFERISGKTLISERFDATIVEGVLTGQNRINIFSGLDIMQGTVEIDRAAYTLDGLIIDDMLGKSVIAVVSTAPYEDNKILGIAVSESDRTVTVNFDDVVSIDSKALTYMDGDTKKKISLSSIENVSHDGVVKDTSVIDYTLVESKDGEIRFSTDGEGSSYVNAVIYTYTTAFIKAIATFSERIYFQGGHGGINGKDYINYNEDMDFIVYVDGEKASVGQLTTGMVASVMENVNQTSAIIHASTKSIKGEITELTEDNVSIDDREYLISADFGTTEGYNLQVGYGGTYNLDYKGRVFRFMRSGDDIFYGYLMDIDTTGSALIEDYVLRVFTSKNEFEILPLKDKLVFDGKGGVTKKEAYEKMLSVKEEICQSPIRYRLDGYGKINFLDTVNETIDDKDDSEALRLDHIFSGALNWTASAKQTSLDTSNYGWTASTPNFVIPTKRESEDDYLYRSGPSYIMNESVTIRLYSCDEYDRAKLLVEDKNFNREGVYTDGYRYALVTMVKSSLNEEGDPSVSVELLDGSNPPNFPRTTYQVLDEGVEKVKKLKPGDIIQLNVKSGTLLRDYKLIASASQFYDSPQDMANEPNGGRAEVIGTIVSVDTDRGFVRIVTDPDGDGIGQYVTCNIQSLGLYDRATGHNYDITKYDLESGDRVFCFGGVSLYRIMVVR